MLLTLPLSTYEKGVLDFIVVIVFRKPILTSTTTYATNSVKRGIDSISESSDPKGGLSRGDRGRRQLSGFTYKNGTTITKLNVSEMKKS